MLFNIPFCLGSFSHCLFRSLDFLAHQLSLPIRPPALMLLYTEVITGNIKQQFKWNRWSFLPKTVQAAQSTQPARVHLQPSPSAPSGDGGGRCLRFLHSDSNLKHLRKGQQHIPFDLSGGCSLLKPSGKYNIKQPKQRKEYLSFGKHTGFRRV